MNDPLTHTQFVDKHQEALAHSRLYDLCRQLYLDGLTTKTLAIVQALPDLAEKLPSPVDADAVAAAYQELFAFNLFPFESIFLAQEGLLNSDHSAAVRAVYDAMGYQPAQRGGAADHLGAELGLLAHLCAAEADAWADGQAAIARRMQHEQWQFLQGHLLRWLAPCAVAIGRHDNPFFAELATITVALVAEHEDALTTAWSAPLAWELPEPPALLADPKSSLHDIATFLITPAYSGFFLSRYIINQLGRHQRLPRGFGSREQMVTNLLRTAAQYEALPALLATLRAELLRWQMDYQALLAAHPTLTPFVQPWLRRSAETVTLLAAMDASIIAALA
jgi:TorA maturation chaperone TorD